MFDFYSKTGRKVFLGRSRTELKAAYEKALQIIPASEIIIQEVIPGDGSNQFSPVSFPLKAEFCQLTAAGCVRSC